MEEKLKKRLGEILVEDGSITPENLTEALAFQKKTGGLIGQALLSMGYLTEEGLTASLSRQLEIPFLPLSQYSINMEAAQSWGEDFCRRNQMIIFEQDEKKIYIALADPLNESVWEEMKKKSKLKIQVFITTGTEINTLLDVIFKTSGREMKKAG